MIKVVFFAQTRELIGLDEIEIEQDFDNAEQLRQYLSAKGDKWALALQADKILAAVNQDLAGPDSPVKAGDEVAFFPPVTGG